MACDDALLRIVYGKAVSLAAEEIDYKGERVVDARDKELVSNGTDCISSLCQLLAAMLPSEEDMRTIFAERDRK